MSQRDYTVGELVAMLQHGEIRLPEMQRRYVWKSTRVRDLLDSLYRGYPSGSILMWQTAEDVQKQDFAIAQKQNAIGTQTLLLLDGQQRLTSLSALIRGEEVTVRGRKRKIDLLFNLEHPDLRDVDAPEVNEEDDQDRLEDETDTTEDELLERFNRMIFLVATRKLEQKPQWVRVSEVLANDDNGPFLESAGVNSFKDPQYKKYNERLTALRKIRDYKYRVDVLNRDMSYKEVTQIFVRVNSLGAKLRSSDLALAQITANWRGALKSFVAFQKQCSQDGFDLDLGLHLRNLITFADGRSNFSRVSKFSKGKLQEAWEESKKGMEYALNFLKENVGIDSPALLSSPFIMVMLAYLGYRQDYHFSAEQGKKLRYWVLVANAKGRYSRGSSETFLDQDLASVQKSGDILQTLIGQLKVQVGRLDISPEEIEGKNQRNAIFKTMFLAFRDAGAKDWYSDLKISISHKGVSHRLQFHHIFPKNLLGGAHTSREVDDVANLAFIGGKTNRKISNKAPSEYFPRIIESHGEDVFKAQCIPTDPALLNLSNYKDFLAARRQCISERLNQFFTE